MAPQAKRADNRINRDVRAKNIRSNTRHAPHFKESISVNTTKSKIRDVKRLLEHSIDLPPGVRIEKERALTGYKQDLEKAVEEKIRNQMISKYHMVRFFERQKATRSLKKLLTQLAAAKFPVSERDEMQKKVHIAEVDVNYTKFYPLTEKYISLFPRSRDPRKGEDMVEKGDSTRPPLWTFVEQCMASNTLNTLREGIYGVKPDGSVKTRKEFAPETKSKLEVVKKKFTIGTGKANSEQDEGEESDGGFFER